MPAYLKDLLAGLHPEVLERFYGCGSPLPPALEGKTVLDLGCGTGRDCYLLSKLVGPAGRVVKQNPISLDDPEVFAKIGMVKFNSVTVRAFKIPLEDCCEDFGQVAVYLGSIEQHPHSFDLDDHHHFETGRPLRVCGNTADMLGATRYAEHFHLLGDKNSHFGLFDCVPGSQAGADNAEGGMLLNAEANIAEERLSEQVLAEHRPVLFRYALLQLRDIELADDAVQETLLSAWQASSSFEGKAGLRTWLIGILKHKIADHWRRSAREVAATDIDQIVVLDNEADEDDFFMSNGHWNGGPKAWNDPETALKQQEFWTIYETCQNNLSPKMAKVFMLRELVGLEADEVCMETGLSDANYWVTMHRARLRLRECLEIRWFNDSKSK